MLADDAVAGRPLRLRGDVRQVTDVFRQVTARQLVVIGEPTAGKSVLAILLTWLLTPPCNSTYFSQHKFLANTLNIATSPERLCAF